MIQDTAYLSFWFDENEECFIIPYIEQNFHESSFQHQYEQMRQFLFFTKAVIEDYLLDNDSKIIELVDKLKYGKSKIIMIVGSRGSGKTAFALFIAELLHEEGRRIIYYVGKPEFSEFYPKWIKFVDDLNKLPDNAFALVDESAIKYSSRRSMTTENVDLTNQLVILRHRGISLMLITQNISMVEVNVDRLADIFLYKLGSNYGIRHKKGSMINKFHQEKMMIFERLRPKIKEDCMIEYVTGSKSIFRKITNKLPTFWDDEKISKSYKGFRGVPHKKPDNSNNNGNEKMSASILN